MLDGVTEAYSVLQLWMFETVVQPLAVAMGAADLLDQAFEGTGWFVLGVLQLLVLALLIGPLQRWRPVEAVTDRAAVRVDMLYTVIHRLGFFKLLMFFTIDNGLEQGIGWLRAQGLQTWHLDQLWPGVTDVAWVSFAIYLVVFDFVDYWYHRLSHRWEWWWALHALHHSQRQLTMWSDNRNHLLDDAIRSAVMVVVAILIGIGPGQFVALVVFGQLSESFQHANVRLGFGWLGERLWVSPRFHRVHHSIGLGHESAGQGSLGGHNYGVLLPWWDMLFGTADFGRGFEPTGIRDQVEPDAQGRLRDYGRGFWAQQWLGLRRLFRSG